MDERKIHGELDTEFFKTSQELCVNATGIAEKLATIQLNLPPLTDASKRFVKTSQDSVIPVDLRDSVLASIDLITKAHRWLGAPDIFNVVFNGYSEVNPTVVYPDALIRTFFECDQPAIIARLAAQRNKTSTTT